MADKAENKEKKTYSAETEAILDGFRLLDDDFMTQVFDQNFEATELLLNVILERDDIHVENMTVQKIEKSPIVKGRTIIVDIDATDSNGKKYDIEVQRSKYGANVKRARFHSAALDHRMLKESQDFKEIEESFVIFITETDVFGKGNPIYKIHRYFDDTFESFDDGNHIIYVNGAYKNDATPIGRLMHDFRCTSSIDMFYDELKKSVHYYKETEGGRAIMCEAMENYGTKKQAEGIIKMGKNLNLTDDQIIANIVAICHVTKEKAAEYLGLQLA